MAENIVTLFQWLVFLGISLTCIFASIMVISNKNPVHCALWMVLTFLATAGLYVMLHSTFIAIVQVTVYAGAIMMLILFVIMLLNLDVELRAKLKFVYSKAIGGFFAVLLMLGIFYAVITRALKGASGSFTPEEVSAIGSAKAVGEVLFTDYLLPFEVASLLLVAGIVGAVILSKRRESKEE
jgi:NADH-quinone oxidoreductase subunit J